MNVVVGNKVNFLCPERKEIVQIVVPSGYVGGQSMLVKHCVPTGFGFFIPNLTASFVCLNKFFGGRDDSNYIGSQILVVGEGDFSFTHALCAYDTYLKNVVFGNLWSTAKDGQISIQRSQNILEIRKHPKVEILIGIDGTQLIGSTELNDSFMRCYSTRTLSCNSNPRLGTKIEQPLFNVIFFTFPKSQGDEASNIALIHNFLKSATQILQDNGEIRLALQLNQYKKWCVADSAGLCGLRLRQESECHWRTLFVPTYTFGGEWIPINPRWFVLVKLPIRHIGSSNRSGLLDWDEI